MNGPTSPRPRFIPEQPLPPYSYVTGLFPHPIRDPDGHSFGHVAPPERPIDPARWRESQAYLRACDLFNYGYYWESHELWESLWHACARQGPQADTLKGLIKFAAGGVKAREGRPIGVERHAHRAAELFAIVQAEIHSDSYLGLDLAALIAIAEDLPNHLLTKALSRAAVEIIFDFQILPGATGAESAL